MLQHPCSDRHAVQVLVYHDLLGMMQHPHYVKVTPKFCKQYASVGTVIQEALQSYRDEVGHSPALLQQDTSLSQLHPHEHQQGIGSTLLKAWQCISQSMEAIHGLTRCWLNPWRLCMQVAGRQFPGPKHTPYKIADKEVHQMERVLREEGFDAAADCVEDQLHGRRLMPIGEE